MESLDYQSWTLDVARGRAEHPCGFSLEVEGDVRNPSSVAPANYPQGLNFAEQARLLRSGMEALAAAANSSEAPKRAPVVNSRAQRAEESARKFAEQRKDRPARPKLSLKKSN